MTFCSWSYKTDENLMGCNILLPLMLPLMWGGWGASIEDLSLLRRNVSLKWTRWCDISHLTLKGWHSTSLHCVMYLKKHLPQWFDPSPGIRCLLQSKGDVLPLCRAPTAISWSCRQRRRQHMGPSMISVSLYAFVGFWSFRKYLLFL